MLVPHPRAGRIAHRSDDDSGDVSLCREPSHQGKGVVHAACAIVIDHPHLAAVVAAEYSSASTARLMALARTPGAARPVAAVAVIDGRIVRVRG